MSFRMLHSAWGGVIRSLSTTPGDDQLVVHDEQEAGAILRANSRDADVDQSGRTFRLAARVPMTVINQAIAEGWLDDRERWKRWLNDPDNRKFRVWGGRV